MNIQARGDVSKLPKWAQEYFESMSRMIERLEEQVAVFDSPNSKIYWSESFDGKGHSVPDNATIAFWLTPQRYIDVSLREEHGEVRLEVYGSTSVTISPEASNHFHISIKE